MFPLHSAFSFSIIFPFANPIKIFPLHRMRRRALHRIKIKWRNFLMSDQKGFMLQWVAWKIILFLKLSVLYPFECNFPIWISRNNWTVSDRIMRLHCAWLLAFQILILNFKSFQRNVLFYNIVFTKLFDWTNKLSTIIKSYFTVSLPQNFIAFGKF